MLQHARCESTDGVTGCPSIKCRLHDVTDETRRGGHAAVLRAATSRRSGARCLRQLHVYMYITCACISYLASAHNRQGLVAQEEQEDLAQRRPVSPGQGGCAHGLQEPLQTMTRAGLAIPLKLCFNRLQTFRRRQWRQHILPSRASPLSLLLCSTPHIIRQSRSCTMHPELGDKSFRACCLR